MLLFFGLQSKKNSGLETASSEQVRFWTILQAVFRIRIGFNADPDPAFYLNAEPDPDPDLGSQTNADSDPDPGHKNLGFEIKNVLYVGNVS